MTVPKKITTAINDSSSFLAHVHLSPDADTMGSVMALKLALESIGKVMEVFCEDEIPAFATFLPGIDAVHQIPLSEALSTFPHEYYLALDTPIYGLLTHLEPVPNFPKPVLVIDHHEDSLIKAKISWVNTSAAATALMVHSLIKKLKIEITPDIATCLLFGILGDTGTFQYLNTDEEVFQTVSDLITKGGDYLTCLVHLQRTIPFYEFKSWGVLLNHLELSEDGDFVYLAVDSETWSQVNPASKIALFANQFLCNVAGTKFGAILVEKREGQVGGTLRSRLPEVDVRQIAERLNGGGHKNSAGFRFQGSLEEAKREFFNAINLLKNQGKL